MFAWLVPWEAMPAIDAVTACPRCQDRHCEILLETRVWWDEPTRTPWTDPTPPPPAEFCSGDGPE